MLEHFERARTVPVLKGWARILRPGGTLKVRAPNLLILARHLLAPDNQDADRAAHLSHLIYGTQAYDGDYHLAGFTPATIKVQIAEAGLTLARCYDDVMNLAVEAIKEPSFVRRLFLPRQ